MSIYCFEPIRVTYHDVFAVSAAFIAHNSDFTAKGSTDRITNVDLYIEPFVLTPPTMTEITCNYTAGSWHTEVA